MIDKKRKKKAKKKRNRIKRDKKERERREERRIKRQYLETGTKAFTLKGSPDSKLMHGISVLRPPRKLLRKRRVN